jgi:tetratricopeptide (TPR) repeat protein/transglutaminase-like putative cysteine protease
MKSSSFCRVVLCFSIVGLSAFRVHGQAGASATGKDPYAAEPVVVERQDTVYTMAADGLGTREVTFVGRVQSDAALREIGVINMPFAANSEHVEFVYVRARHKDGTVTETPVSAALEVLNPVTQAAPFYSDLKQMQLPVRTLGVSDTLEWKARVIRTKAEAPGEFWGAYTFLQNVVTLEESVELRVPKDKYVQPWSLAKKATDTIAGDQRIIRWESSYLKPTVGAAADAEKEARKKHVLTDAEELDEREGKLPDIAWTTFKSWEAVGAWYRGLEGDRMVPDAGIKAKVDELTAGKTTEQQKLEAVYSYVATNVRYIGVAFGIGRYQPHAAGNVLENQYGDCKDKHTLLAAMLQALGYKPDAVLIGAGIRFNEAVPSPAAFNHLITRVTIEGKPVFLDTTAEVAPYGMLLASIRDEQALAIPDTGTATVIRTPLLPPFVPYQQLEAKGAIDSEGTSNSHLVLTMHGDDEVAIRQVLRQIGPDKWDLLAQRMVQGWGYAGEVSHADFSSASDLSQPLKVSFDYKRVKGGDWDHLRIVPQFAAVLLPRPSLTEPLTETINLGTPRVEHSTAEMKLPQGWGAELPEAVHRRSPYVTLDVTYRFDKGTIYADRKLEVLKEKVPLSDWKTYSAWAEAVGVGDESYLQLTRPDGAKTVAVAPPIEEKKAEPASAESKNLSNEKMIATWMQQAGAILDDTRNAPADATSLLDQVRMIKPDQPGLWAMYGYVRFRSGAFADAEKDYRKELSLHSSNMQVYPYLVQVQLLQKERQAAQASLRDWAAAEPSNAAPTLQLAQLLLDDGEYAKAVEVAQAGLANAPKDVPADERVTLVLGRSELKAGMKEKGQATLVALLKQTDNPGTMNDAAYELADAGLELPLAEQTARAALERMEEQSRTWTLDENTATLRQKTRLLQATWDTVGWIYFRNGKVDEAERYVRASWRGHPDAEIGKHLAAIDLARGKRNEALEDLEMANATFPPYDLIGVHKAPDAPQKQVLDKIAELKKAGAKSSLIDAKAELDKMRHVPLGSSWGMSGVAEYKLLISGESIERVELTGKKDLTGGEERVKKVRLPGMTPAGSKAQLVSEAMLNCHQSVCELLLIE